MRNSLVLILICFFLASEVSALEPEVASKESLVSNLSGMVLIPDGFYLPFFLAKKENSLKPKKANLSRESVNESASSVETSKPKKMTILSDLEDQDKTRNEEGNKNEKNLGHNVYDKADSNKNLKKIFVKSFWMDIHPVTKEKFLEFLKKNPRWMRSKVAKIFTDGHYLEGWKGDLDFSESEKNMPVVQISWYVAKAYCEFYEKSLPTLDQWEYVADDRGDGPQRYQREILDWYAKPTKGALKSIGQSQPNTYKVYDMYSLIWEWVLDFNSAIIGDETRGETDSNQFCGSGVLGSADPSDYARFMRYSFRSSLKANYTTRNLGFRCVKNL